MSPTLADRLQPALDAIDVVQSALANKSYEEFRGDTALRLAPLKAFAEQIVRESEN